MKYGARLVSRLQRLFRSLLYLQAITLLVGVTVYLLNGPAYWLNPAAADLLQVLVPTLAGVLVLFAQLLGYLMVAAIRPSASPERRLRKYAIAVSIRLGLFNGVNLFLALLLPLIGERYALLYVAVGMALQAVYWPKRQRAKQAALLTREEAGALF